VPLRGFISKKVPERPAVHPALNELVARAGIPVTKEPNGLSRPDGKQPDGLFLVPWEEEKPLTWDVTVVCPLAYLLKMRDPSFSRFIIIIIIIITEFI